MQSTLPDMAAACKGVSPDPFSTSAVTTALFKPTWVWLPCFMWSFQVRWGLLLCENTLKQALHTLKTNSPCKERGFTWQFEMPCVWSAGLGKQGRGVSEGPRWVFVVTE